MSERIHAGKLSDLDDQSLSSIEHDEKTILLYRDGDEVRAFTCKCPHVGAPLDKGRATDGRFYCMAHHTTFDTTTGASIEPPALDDLERYKVDIEGDDVYVHPDPIARDFPQPVTPADKPLFIVLGGGAAAATAVETLRREAFPGRILMVSPEDSWPYDRTRLSKAVMADPENESRKTLRDDDFYKTIGVERIVAEATMLNPQQRKVELDNGDTYEYDKLLIATGSQSRTLDIPGAGLKGVFTLRRPEDAEAINASAKEAKQAVIVGASFIGLECASGLREQGLRVDVVEKLSTPFEKALGRQLGKRLQKLHEENGVTFHLNASIKAFHGQNRIENVELENDKILEAQIVILGLGVQPCTSFIENLELNDDGGINVNADMSVSGTNKTLFAAGDIAAFPWPPDGDTSMRFEHWRTAMQTGQRAARGMVDIESLEPLVPFFWTRQHKFTLRYVGHATSTEKTSIDGDLDSKDFRLNYFQDNALRAVAASRNDQEMIVIHEAFRRGEFTDYDTMQSDNFSWI